MVREKEHEFPLTPQEHTWPQPDPPMLTKPYDGPPYTEEEPYDGPPYTEEELYPGGLPKDRSHKRGRPRRLEH